MPDHAVSTERVSPGAADAGYALAQEALAAWCCACQAWGDYMMSLATIAPPYSSFEAGTRLMLNLLELPEHAAAQRLDGVGPTPLLSDP